MIRRLFIANRGEIALRVIRTARRLGMTTILGVSAADRESLPARLADEMAPVDNYLSIDSVIGAAVAAKADAIHPGYGFLSENAAFGRAAAEVGIVFVGPDPETLDAMGDKLNARRIAGEAGLPTVPGREGGYPLLIKAVAGGGGRGMKRVDREAELERAWRWPRPRRRRRSATAASMSSGSSPRAGMSRCRCSATASGPCISATATARSSGASRSSSRRRPRRTWTTRRGRTCTPPRCPRPSTSAIAAPGPSSSCGARGSGSLPGDQRATCRSNIR